MEDEVLDLGSMALHAAAGVHAAGDRDAAGGQRELAGERAPFLQINGHHSNSASNKF